jgi:hypothetical protein
MKKKVVLLAAALSVSACGITGKLDAVSHFEASRASYKACLAGQDAGSNCELQRAGYESDLKDAERTRGTLTDWRWL